MLELPIAQPEATNARSESSTRLFRALLAAIVLSAAGLPAFALADTKIRVDIPAQDLGSALKAFSAAANEQVLFSDTVVAGHRSTNSLSGCHRRSRLTHDAGKRGTGIADALVERCG